MNSITSVAAVLAWYRMDAQNAISTADLTLKVYDKHGNFIFKKDLKHDEGLEISRDLYSRNCLSSKVDKSDPRVWILSLTVDIELSDYVF